MLLENVINCNFVLQNKNEQKRHGNVCSTVVSPVWFPNLSPKPQRRMSNMKLALWATDHSADALHWSARRDEWALGLGWGGHSNCSVSCSLFSKRKQQ